MNIDQFLLLLAEQQATRPPGWRLAPAEWQFKSNWQFKPKRVRDANHCCPIDSLAAYLTDWNKKGQPVTPAYLVLGMDFDAYLQIIAAADGSFGDYRGLRGRMLAACGLEGTP